MTAKPPPASLVPSDVGMNLFNDLDVLFASTAREICQLDVENGALAECTPQAELLRRLAVIVKAGAIIGLMENAVLAQAVADPLVSQAAMAPALNVTQQAVSSRIARLKNR